MIPSSPQVTPNAQQVMELSARGWRVHPLHSVNALGVCSCDKGEKCASPGKHPRVNAWQKAATTDEEVISDWWERWPAANVAVVMGPTSGIMDLECDSTEAEEFLKNLFEGYPEALETPTFRSSRGVHRLFKYTSDLPSSEKAHWKLPGIDLDFKIGNGSLGTYCVFPPSRHQSGAAYRWEKHPDDYELQSVPDEVIARLHVIATEGGLTVPGEKRRPKEHWDRILAGVGEGERNESAASLIGNLASNMADPADKKQQAIQWKLVAAWNEAMNKPPMDVDELKATFLSIVSREISKRAKKTFTKSPDEEASGRIAIQVTAEQHEVINQTIAALASLDDQIFQRSRSLVKVDGGEILEIAEANLGEHLTRHIYFYELKSTKKGDTRKHCQPPNWLVKAIHTREIYPEIRTLEGVITSPVLKRNGDVLTTPGYDAEAKLFFAPVGEIPIIADRPTFENAKDAANQLLELISDFPFAKAEHKSAWLAGLLTLFGRQTFEGPAPLFLIDANSSGCGKGLLVKATNGIFSENELQVTAYCHKDEEMRKRILAIACSGRPLILMDNVDGEFGLPSLDAALTATTVTDRPMGASKEITAPLRGTWFVTGNNVQVLRDTVRRVCHIRLVSPLELPEERESFKIKDLLKHIRDNRSTYLSAALTTLRAYFVAGRPDMRLKAWGSFEGWSSVIRNCIVWMGFPDPETGREALRNCSDSNLLERELLFEAFEKIDPNGEGVTAALFCNRIAARPEFGDLQSRVCEREGVASTREMGTILKRHRDSQLRGKVLTYREGRARSRHWLLRPV